MLTNKRILMVVPYKARDLEGHALVGHQLSRHYNYDVKFTNGYRLETKILDYAPDALVLDHLSWNFKVKQAKLAKSLGMKVVILPTEGLFQDAEGAVRRAGKLHNAAHLPDLYLTWGDYPRRAILEQNLMHEAQMQTIGCPRFDFYCSPYLKLMPTKAELIEKLGFKNKDAPLILWATNTPYASRSASLMLQRQTKRAKKPAGEVAIHIEDHKIQFREHSKIIVELARRHPEWNFVIKVHPAEWINPYLEIERAAANIKIAYNAPIGQFLFYSDALLQRNCTTATEAWMLKKPVLNLEIGKYHRPVRAEYAAGNHCVENVDETENSLKKYLREPQIPCKQQIARDAFIADFYFKIDGKSSVRCAAAINRILSTPEYSQAAQIRKDTLTIQAGVAKKRIEDTRLINKIKDLFGFERNASLRFWKKYLRREATPNAGLFKAEPEITVEMVTNLYQVFDDLQNHQNVEFEQSQK